VRFEVSRVLDTVEQRITTDVTLAQAVVDLADVARFERLDGGRSINLLRLGMVVDALAQYLLDGAAMVYPIAGRELLADPALTSKERMVLGRWVDDGRIEAAPTTEDRVLEIADYTGMPVIACRDYGEHADRFPWIIDSPERLLRLTPKPGKAVVGPAFDRTLERSPGEPGERVVGKYSSPQSATPEPADLKGGRVFAHNVVPPQTRVSTRAIEPAAQPSSLGATLLARRWGCPEPDCPSFGPHRRLGQSVPRLVKGVASCPRHASPLKDLGTRPAEYPVAVVIDDVVRRRFPVTATRSVHVGRSLDDPEDVSLELWLHEAAADWISERHAELEIAGTALTVTAVGENGLVIWHHSAAGEAGESLRLAEGQTYTLQPYDSIELYTGIELVPGNRRVMGGPVTASDLRSVLVDAPTVAFPSRRD
jgi:hypothetical protein